MNDAIPLAERMRPITINDVVGQKHLTGDDGVLKRRKFTIHYLLGSSGHR